MPEAPELIYFRKYLQSTSLKQTITSVEVLNSNILENSTEDDLVHYLEGSEFESCTIHGKYLFLHTNSDQDLVMHFGMTGSPVYFKNEKDRPEYSRAEIHFDNGYTLSYNCLRMLGMLDLTDNKQQYIQSKELGPDVTSETFDSEVFIEQLKGRRGYIKSALMDQKRLAGIGNECSDEILFQAGIHPKKEVSELDEDDLKQIFHELTHVIKEKAEANKPDGQLPNSFLLKNREEGAECPNCNGNIEKITIAGRSGYYCPSCQNE